MKVIALVGKSNIGKTTILSLLYHKLLKENFIREEGTYKDLDGEPKDFTDILKYENFRIGFVTQGDYSLNGAKSKKNKDLALHSHLKYFFNSKCDFVICAWSTSNKHIQEDIKDFDLIIIPKLSKETDTADQDKENRKYVNRMAFVLNKFLT